MAESLQDRHDGPARLGVDRIVETGDEQGDLHPAQLPRKLICVPVRRPRGWIDSGARRPLRRQISEPAPPSCQLRRGELERSEPRASVGTAKDRAEIRPAVLASPERSRGAQGRCPVFPGIIGKPVRLRRGPATVTGELYPKCHCAQAWEGGQEPSIFLFFS